MSKIRSQRCPKTAPSAQFRFHPLVFLGLAVLAWLLVAWPARAEEPDDHYLRIFELIEQADNLAANGQSSTALAKYKDAQAQLEKFRRTYPDWKVKMVAYRQKYLAEKLAPPPEKPAPPATTDSASPTEKAPPPTAAPATTSASQARLLEAGAEPRKPLRLHPEPGLKQSVSMAVKMGVETKVGEMETPPMKFPVIKMELDLTVKSVSPEGDITYELVLGEAGVIEEPGVTPMVAEAMKSAFANVKGLSGTGTLSDRGFSKGLEMKAAAGAEPQMQQLMNQVKDSFSAAANPFPEEAVGPGAKWEVKLPIKSQGMTIEQTTTYQLISLEGERATVKSSIAQRASKQKVQNPVMAGMKADLAKMTGKGTGNITLDLGRLWPVEGTIDSHSDMAMSLELGGQPQAMTLKMDSNVHLESK